MSSLRLNALFDRMAEAHKGKLSPAAVLGIHKEAVLNARNCIPIFLSDIKDERSGSAAWMSVGLIIYLFFSIRSSLS